jgi:hypothetical protein
MREPAIRHLFDRLEVHSMNVRVVMFDSEFAMTSSGRSPVLK